MRSGLVYAGLAIIAVAGLSLQGTLAELGVIDDAYISARYAEHFAVGNEFSFNWGQRVEGYTNFLWVLLAGLGAKAGLPAAAGVLVLSLAAGCAGVVLVGDFCLRELQIPAAGALAVSAGLACLTPWAAWAWSGMETCGFGVLWFAALWCYVRAKGPRGWIGSGVLAALTAMTRPEGMLLAVVVIGYYRWRERNLSKTLVTIGTFLAVLAIYVGWRYHYFGQLLPNTYYAKVGRPSGALALRGAAYLGNFLLGSAPLGVLVALSGLKPSVWRDRWGLAAIGLGVAVYVVPAVILVGGDHFAMYRFCVPLLPSLVVLAWAGVAGLFRVLGAGRWTDRHAAVIGPAVVLGVCILANITMLSTPMSGRSGPTHLARLKDEIRYARQWAYIGRQLRHRYGPDKSVATFAIGAIGYFSKMTVWDMQGLIHPEIARRPLPTGSGYSGHEKYDSRFILAQRPDVILLLNQLQPDARPRPGMLWGQASKDLAKNNDFKRQYRYVAFRTPQGLFIHVYERRTHDDQRAAIPAWFEPRSNCAKLSQM